MTGAPATGIIATDGEIVEAYVNVLAINGFYGMSYEQWFKVLAATWVILLLIKNTYNFYRWVAEVFNES